MVTEKQPERYSSTEDFDLNKGQGPAMQTITGKLVFLLNPQPEQISIYDIAHGLSYQCRYNGQLPQFYSVAQHSVLVAEFMEQRGYDQNKCLKALLHDAHEAYIGDIVTPLKALMPDYTQVENQIDDVICDKFGVERGMDQDLHYADKKLLATEIRDLRPHGAIDYPGAPKLQDPIEDLSITPTTSNGALTMFLQKYLEYTQQ